MKGEKGEFLIPMEETRRKESSSCIAYLLTLTIILSFGFAVYRYETIICDLEMRVRSLEIRSVHKDFTPIVMDRRKRETGAALGIPPWVKRSGEGEPVLNDEYRQYMQRQETRSQPSGRRNPSSSSRNQITSSLVRNHAEETYAVGQEVRPSGLKEIYERLPPLSQEVLYETPARPLEVRSRDSQGQRSFPPVQRVGSGNDQVNARVIRYEDDILEETRQPLRQNLRTTDDAKEAIAAHFVADVSNFTANENPRLRNSNGIFQIWKPSEWMNSKWFTLDKLDGTVTVLKGGLYQIYSQIHYHDEHEDNSYVVEVEDKAILQCTTTRDSHSCFTGGVANLKEGDKVLIKNVGVDRFSIYKPEKSFFGLIRLGNAPWA